MGKGFYDRTIFHLKLKNPKLINIGIAFDFQQSWQALPNDPHDLALDFIITNTNSHIQIT
jgi:5-formyltetrahydrofolate cyclo-ligase